MDDKNKYYPPELNEFCVGFEYEQEEYDGTYTKLTLSEKDSLEYISDHSDEFRVKYLDRGDVEECGFTFLKKDWGNDVYEKPVYKTGKLTLYLERTYVIILCKDGEYDVTLFRGNIKNKTEFKKVIKMLWV